MPQYAASPLSFRVYEDRDVGHQVVISQELAPTEFVFPLLPHLGAQPSAAVTHMLAGELARRLEAFADWLLDAGLGETDWNGLLEFVNHQRPDAPQGVTGALAALPEEDVAPDADPKTRFTLLHGGAETGQASGAEGNQLPLPGAPTEPAD